VGKKMMRLREIMEKPIIVTAEERYEEWGEQCKSLDIKPHLPIMHPITSKKLP